MGDTEQRCGVCGEWVQEGRYHEKDGKVLCIACGVKTYKTGILSAALGSASSTSAPPVGEDLATLAQKLAASLLRLAQGSVDRISGENLTESLEAIERRTGVLQEVLLAQRIAAALDVMADKVIAKRQ